MQKKKYTYNRSGVFIDKDLHKQLKPIAKKSGVTLYILLNTLIKEFLQKAGIK